MWCDSGYAETFKTLESSHLAINKMIRVKWWLKSWARKKKNKNTHIAEFIWIYFKEPGEYLLRDELFYLTSCVYPSAAEV